MTRPQSARNYYTIIGAPEHSIGAGKYIHPLETWDKYVLIFSLPKNLNTLEISGCISRSCLSNNFDQVLRLLRFLKAKDQFSFEKFVQPFERFRG